MRISDAERDKIRQILFLPARSFPPRCPAKDQRIVKKLEANGDFSHRDKEHICEKCRCKKAAGEGTTGDFYGLGEHTGHFGVGFCKWHEKGRRAAHAEEFAEHQMHALQIGKNTQRDMKRFLKETEEAAIVGKENTEIRQGMILLKETIDEFRRRCVKGKNGDSEEEALFEYVGKNAEKKDMSDKTRMELAQKLATAASRLARDKYALDSAEYIHVDDVSVRIQTTMNLVRRLILDEKTFDKFLREYKDTWTSIPTGAK